MVPKNRIDAIAKVIFATRDSVSETCEQALENAKRAMADAKQAEEEKYLPDQMSD